MSGNAGAWGVAMWKDGHSGSEPQALGISLEGGDPILPYLPTDPVGTLLVPPAGLGVPPVRSGDVAFAQRDGVVQFADYYEPRQITLQVLVKNDDCPGCSAAEPRIDGALVLNGVAPGRASTPDTAALDITGDIDIRVHAAMDDWTPAGAQALITKSTTAGNQISWRFNVLSSGLLRLNWSANGSATMTADSTIAPSVLDGEDLWVRVTLDVDNGAAGRTITFYTSLDGFTWIQLGTPVVQAGVTSIFSGSAPVVVGSRDEGANDRLVGRVFSAQIRTGIEGPIVADPNFVQPAGTWSFVDDVGRTWTVTSPAFLQPFVAAKMSARQKVSRLTQEWSRNCSGATLLLFSDCHNPQATEEEKVYLGPYLVHGRPRVADVVWERSNRGAARVTLRFDAADAQLLLADTPAGSPWTAQHSSFIETNENLLPDPDFDTLTMTANGATVVDNHFTSGGPSGPDGGPYFSRDVQTLPGSSPMAMALSGTGTSGIPVDPADVLSMGWWARKNNPAGGIPQTRLDWTWYNAAGGVISSHTGTAQTALADWQRFLEQNIVAPALAEFIQPRLVWTGIPGAAGYMIDLAQGWLNEGATTTGPTTLEVVGTLCVYPVFHMFGDLTAPITVTYGHHEFTYDEDISGVVDVDTRWGRASLGTVDVTENLSGDFSSPLEPGVHDLMVQTGDPADDGFVSVEWANAVVSG